MDKTLLNDYISKGFGSMSKKDFELFIFNEWLKDEDNIGKSDFDISRELKITESKVKSLRYEASIVYGDSVTDKDLIDAFVRDLSRAKYKKENEKLVFPIKDKLVRQFINNKLESDGRYLDSSLTSSSVSLYIDDFIYLIGELKIVNKDLIVSVAKEKANKNHDFPITFGDVIKKVIVVASEQVLGKLSTNAIVEILKQINDKDK